MNVKEVNMDELEVVKAAERAVRKMELLYRRNHPDAEDGECWAEAEILRDALDRLGGEQAPAPTTPEVLAQIADTYGRMAIEANYRPAAPSDGLGNITAPLWELDLTAEAEAYAHRWWEQEDKCEYLIGCANFEDRPAMIFLLEAARFCCSGGDGPERALPLLRMATEELESRSKVGTLS